MDPTLTAILQALYQAHQAIDALNKHVAELEAELAAKLKAEVAPSISP